GKPRSAARRAPGPPGERAPAPVRVPEWPAIGAHPRRPERRPSAVAGAGFHAVARNPAVDAAHRRRALQAGGRRFEPCTAHSANALLWRLFRSSVCCALMATEATAPEPGPVLPIRALRESLEAAALLLRE